MNKVAIFGSQNILSLDNLENYFPIPNKELKVYHGTAISLIDEIVGKWAHEKNVDESLFTLEREAICDNTLKPIFDLVDYIIVFWDLKSEGTKQVIQYAFNQDKPFTVYLCEKNDEDKWIINLDPKYVMETLDQFTTDYADFEEISQDNNNDDDIIND